MMISKMHGYTKQIQLGQEVCAIIFFTKVGEWGQERNIYLYACLCIDCLWKDSQADNIVFPQEGGQCGTGSY